MSDNKNSENEEKTVLLNEDEDKTVLLDNDGEDGKTVLLDEEPGNVNTQPESTGVKDAAPAAGNVNAPKAEQAVSVSSGTAPEKSGSGTQSAGGNGKKRCMGCMEEIPENEDPCLLCGYSPETYDAKIHQLPPGSTLNNRYIIGKVIGEGGFGITYIGFDPKLDIKVAIKEYFPHSMVMRDVTGDRGNTVSAYGGKNKDMYEKYLSRFFSEARTLAKLQGIDGVVHVQDYFTENDTAYIIMEYVDGEDLKEYAKERGGQLTVKAALDLFRPVAEALSQLHKHNILHRDISPDNIMVTKEGKVTLIDLGASREFGDMQKSMSVLLKPGYAPLEQYSSSEKQGEFTDIYAFCASLYRTITGKRPPEVMDRVEKDELERPSKLGVLIDENVENALMKGLSVHAADRYQTMDELIDGLYNNKPVAATDTGDGKKGSGGSSGENGGGGTGTGTGKGTDTEKAKSRLPIIIGLAAAGAGVAALIAILVATGNSGGDNQPPDTTTTVTDASGSTSTETDTSGPTTTVTDTSETTTTSVQSGEGKTVDAGNATILTDNGSISVSGQQDSFDFVTPRDGRYRVEMSGMPAGMTVNMAYYDSSGKELESARGCGNGDGMTVKYLDANANYRIKVSQASGSGPYTLNVGVQKPTVDLTGVSQVNDRVEYTDQRNLYYFKVPHDGTYRFGITGLTAGTNVQMYIFDDPGNKIDYNDSCGNGEGLTLQNVTAGTIYEIQVRQNMGLSEYMLTVSPSG